MSFSLHSNDRQAGAMLIIALGVLALMVILATAFASLMRLERKATENYVDAKRMDLLLSSALDHVVAQLQGGKNFRSFTFYGDTPWLYMLKDEKDLAHGRVGVEDERVGKWEVFAQRAGHDYRYKTKVIDCAAMINLNGQQDSLGRMLDNLGWAIERSERLKRDGKHYRNPFHVKPNGGGDQVMGVQILQLRQRLPGARFTSKSQLRQLIGPENYDIVKDFVTTSSWEDPYTFKPSDGVNEVVDPSGMTAVGGGGGRALGGGGGASRLEPAYGSAARIDPEPRHPVNINTAPEEVLVACIQGLAGRRIFPYAKFGGGGSLVPVDQNATIQGQRLIANEEYRDVTPRGVFVYTPRLEYDEAKKIALRIIAQRKIRPFIAWRTNDPSQPGFEDFVDMLDESFFPAPDRCVIIDPDQPRNTQIQGLIVGGGGATPISRLWVKGHGVGAVRSLRNSVALAMHDRNAWYFDLIKGVLKANFNPNTRINRYNPNGSTYVCVDKSDLVYAQADRTRTWKGHTTEFCFDTMGVYEVTTLGRIWKESTGVRGPRTVVSGQATEDPRDFPAFERKVRSVVKVFEVLRHTNQFQFEKSFITGSRSSRNDRKRVVTLPDPMEALTELVSAGSMRDGRIELAGLNDSVRQELPVQMRTNYFRNFPALLYAESFQDRDQTSIANLRRIRMSEQRSIATEQLTDTMRDIFNADLSKLRSTNARYLRLAELRQLNVFKNPSAAYYDPLINKEVLGTDVFPDGFNSSLLRTTHLQARMLAVASRVRIGDSSAGGGNVLVGESGRGTRGNNTMGHVPYYRGGLAFWVKFEFDGDDPVFSGLIGCTSVIRQVLPNASDYTGSEGTQFYIFRNSEGRLRVVRMYYHQAFLEAAGGSSGSSGGGSDKGDGINLYPNPGLSGAGGGDAGTMQNPILDELDTKKIISRSDILVDVRHFKAHEWHHIALDWDDENPTYPIRLYLDFQELKDAGPPVIPQLLVDGTANSWVRLNERQPKDALQIGGFVREQGVTDAGVFKWFTNSTSATSAGGIQTVAPEVKRLLANATIDEVITYEGTFPGVKTYYGAQGAPGYFATQRGEYANVFEVPLPPDVDHVVLRSFDWTSYYPTMYSDSRINSVPHRLPVVPIQCDLTFNTSGSPPSAFSEPWRQPSIANLVAGRTVYASSGSVEKKQKAEVVYKFTMVGARSQVGNTAGGVVGTPAIDDVTLTYFLSNPRILGQEEEE